MQQRWPFTEWIAKAPNKKLLAHHFQSTLTHKALMTKKHTEIVIRSTAKALWHPVIYWSTAIVHGALDKPWSTLILKGLFEAFQKVTSKSNKLKLGLCPFVLVPCNPQTTSWWRRAKNFTHGNRWLRPTSSGSFLVAPVRARALAKSQGVCKCSLFPHHLVAVPLRDHNKNHSMGSQSVCATNGYIVYRCISTKQVTYNQSSHVLVFPKLFLILIYINALGVHSP